MAFGMTSKGANGYMGINSDWPSVVFIGKAVPTMVGTVFPSDAPNLRYTRPFLSKSPQLATTVNYAGVGALEFHAYASQYACYDTYYRSASMAIPNTSGFFNYTVDSPQLPHVFTNTTLDGVSVAIAGIRNSGVIGANGWPRWAITAIISYPAGLRNGALPHVSLYCFAPTYDTQPPGVGLRAYDANDRLVFNSSLNPLRVQDILTISRAEITGADLATLKLTATSLSSPVKSYKEVIKPAFLNVDWARYVVVRAVSMGDVTVWAPMHDGPNVRWICLGSGAHPTYTVSETYATAGISLKADKTLQCGLAMTGYSNPDIYAGANSSINTSTLTRHEALPANIPVINGADYD